MKEEDDETAVDFLAAVPSQRINESFIQLPNPGMCVHQSQPFVQRQRRWYKTRYSSSHCSKKAKRQQRWEFLSGLHGDLLPFPSARHPAGRCGIVRLPAYNRIRGEAHILDTQVSTYCYISWFSFLSWQKCAYLMRLFYAGTSLRFSGLVAFTTIKFCQHYLCIYCTYLKLQRHLELNSLICQRLKTFLKGKKTFYFIQYNQLRADLSV